MPQSQVLIKLLDLFQQAGQLSADRSQAVFNVGDGARQPGLPHQLRSWHGRAEVTGIRFGETSIFLEPLHAVVSRFDGRTVHTLFLWICWRSIDVLHTALAAHAGF